MMQIRHAVAGMGFAARIGGNSRFSTGHRD
jgi:hypothetical protein